MKKLFTFLLVSVLLLFLVPSASAVFGQRPVTVYKLFNSQTITKNTNASSVAVDLRQIAQGGFFAVKYTITGTGTVSLEYTSCETDDGTFVEPSTADDIATGLTKTSGTSGTDITSFKPILNPFLKIKVTETGTSADAVITLYLFIQ